jgi:hypothetical protein
MNKKSTYLVLGLAMPLLTVLVWVIWVLLLPSIRAHFLHSVSTKVERNILKNKKRRTKGLRKASSKKASK